MTFDLVPLGELMPSKKQSVDPRKTPDQEYELFSIPAFDTGSPEVISGKDIGSSKQVVEPGDVLLSKIVPHIRRAWAVQPLSERPTIGSSEWIIFRSDRFDPAYLRHALVSDRFHQAFMQTVAGVGGSLMRARPSYVANIDIPLPRLDEQRRIAAVLDAADELRAKRRQAVAKLDTLTQAIFVDMFGTPHQNVHRFVEAELGDLCHVRGGKRLPKGSDYASEPTEFPYIRATDFSGGVIETGDLKFLTPEIQTRISRYTVSAGDVVISIAGSIGQIASVPLVLDGANLTENAAKLVRKDENVLATEYLASYLRSNFAQAQIASRTGQVTIGKLALFRIAGLQVLVPPIELQTRYEGALRALHRSRLNLVRSADQVDTLFATLQQRAFSG